MYTEMATKFCEIPTLLLTVAYMPHTLGTTYDKSKVEISQNFVAFLEYMNFIGLKIASFYLRISI